MKYTKEFLEPLVNSSFSYSEVLRKLNLQFTGGNNSHIRKVISREQIDVSHFKGSNWNKGKIFGPKRHIDDYLSNKVYITSNDLKLRLIREGYFQEKCEKCGLSEWFGDSMPLELHHKDNNHNNNNLENLQILCPNCHYLTHKLDRDCQKAKKKKESLDKEKKRKSKPKPNIRKVERPPYNILLEEIKNSNYSAVGRKYGVSDNAIRKWISFYEKQSQVSPN
jgi:predicted nucleic-acid-binding Zn-ribbon protein